MKATIRLKHLPGGHDQATHAPHAGMVMSPDKGFGGGRDVDMRKKPKATKINDGGHGGKVLLTRKFTDGSVYRIVESSVKSDVSWSGKSQIYHVEAKPFSKVTNTVSDRWHTLSTFDANDRYGNNPRTQAFVYLNQYLQMATGEIK